MPGQGLCALPPTYLQDVVSVRSPSGGQREGQSGGGGWGGGEWRLLPSPEPEQACVILGSQEVCGGNCKVSGMDTGLILLRGGRRPKPREVTGCRVQRRWAGEAGAPPSSPTPSWVMQKLPPELDLPGRRRERRDSGIHSMGQHSQVRERPVPGPSFYSAASTTLARQLSLYYKPW